MSVLLTFPPYSERNDDLFLIEMNKLTEYHYNGCADYARVWTNFKMSYRLEDLPYLHVGIFKHLILKTTASGILHERIIMSSSTTGTASSKITLDRKSSQLQSRSALAILENFVGSEQRPVLVIDSAKSLSRRGEISARIAAAMSLRPLSTKIYFLLKDAEDPASMNWEKVASVLEKSRDVLVYGFTWMIWFAWAKAKKPPYIEELLTGARINFVHSGGWKKLESIKINRDQMEETLLQSLNPSSKVVDYYGMVEQMGIIYPLCEHGYRHPPVWADVLVRDPYTMTPLEGTPGMLQLMNVIAWGAPYHNVLTEDLAVIVPGPCPCGRTGKRFKLAGRIPKSEVRGCANV